MAKQSVMEQTPVSTAVQAGVAGMDNEKIAGVRLSQAFIKADREKAEQAAKEGESLKSRLTKLLALTKKEHEAFAATMNEEREAMKERAKAAGFSKLDDYFKKGGRNGQVDYYLQTSISVWLKFSSSLARGWQVSAERIKTTSWQDLQKEARDFKPPQPNNGPTITTDTDRQAAIIADQQKLVKDAEKFAEQHMTKRTEQGGLALSEAARGALADAVVQLCKWATPAEIDLCIAKLRDWREKVVKAQEEAAAAAAKAANSAKKEAPAPAAETGNIGETVAEHAEAKPESKKRTRKGEKATA